MSRVTPFRAKEEAGLVLFRKPFTGTALASKIREVLHQGSGQSLIRSKKKG
jgi:hypothetical protein